MSKPELRLIKGGGISDDDAKRLAKIERLSQNAESGSPLSFQANPEALSNVKRLWQIIENLEKGEFVSDADLGALAAAAVRLHFNEVISLDEDEFKQAGKKRVICDSARNKIREQLRFYLQSVGEI